MSVINNYSALIWGLGILVAIFIPFFIYGKYFFTDEKYNSSLTFFEIIVKAFAYQIVVLILFSIAVEVIKYALPSNSPYSPILGLKTFFLGGNTSNVGIPFWDIWQNIVKNTASAMPSDTNPTESTIYTLKNIMLAISYISMFLFFAVFGMALLFPFMNAIKEFNIKARTHAAEDSVAELIFKVFAQTLIFYLIVYLHFYIVSIITGNLIGVSGFDFYKMLQTTLKNIIAG